MVVLIPRRVGLRFKLHLCVALGMRRGWMLMLMLIAPSVIPTSPRCLPSTAPTSTSASISPVLLSSIRNAPSSIFRHVMLLLLLLLLLVLVNIPPLAPTVSPTGPAILLPCPAAMIVPASRTKFRRVVPIWPRGGVMHRWGRASPTLIAALRA